MGDPAFMTTRNGNRGRFRGKKPVWGSQHSGLYRKGRGPLENELSEEKNLKKSVESEERSKIPPPRKYACENSPVKKESMQQPGETSFLLHKKGKGFSPFSKVR